MDNDPKHCSNRAKKWFEGNNIIHWPTPAQSPDLNCIELVWHSLKTYVRKNCRNKDHSSFTTNDFIKKIREFWSTLTPEVCQTYIEHIPRVIPHVIINNGHATPF